MTGLHPWGLRRYADQCSPKALTRPHPENPPFSASSILGRSGTPRTFRQMGYSCHSCCTRMVHARRALQESLVPWPSDKFTLQWKTTLSKKKWTSFTHLPSVWYSTSSQYSCLTGNIQGSFPDGLLVPHRAWGLILFHIHIRIPQNWDVWIGNVWIPRPDFLVSRAKFLGVHLLLNSKILMSHK